MIKKILILVSVVIVLFSSIIFVISNKKSKNKNDAIAYETVSDEEENKFDPVDYHYYVKLIKYEQQNVKKNATREEREKYYYYDNNIKEGVFEMCKKNGEWEYIVYTDKMGEYNKKDGLLGDFKFDSLKLINDDEIAPYIYVEASNEKVKRLYHIYWDEIFDIKVELISEENLKTNEIINYELKTFTKENTRQNFIDLCKEGMKYLSEHEWAGTYYGDNVAVSNNFRKKYPCFLDIFIHYSPLEYNKITLKDIDIDNLIATFEVDSVLECKKRTYEVKYVLDNNQYLDDMEVKLLNESAYAGNRSERTNKVLYKHSNWDSLDLTDDFLSKYSSDNGLLPNIDKIDIDVKIKETYVNPNDYYQYIYNLKTKDNKDIYYFVKFDCDNKGNIDNISFEDLPYDSSMTLEEVRDAFLDDKELQKELGIEISE